MKPDLTKHEKFLLGAIPVRWQDGAFRNRHGTEIDLCRTLNLHYRLEHTFVDRAIAATVPEE